jgi:hypothetical protein
MLSPYATNREALNFGGTVTVTANVQTSARAFASVTVHVTFVDPAGNVDPVGGVQVGPTSGASPPATVGSGYTTETGAPAGETADAPLGHVSFGGVELSGGVGATDVLSPHACSASAGVMMNRAAMSDRNVWGKAQLTH